MNRPLSDHPHLGHLFTIGVLLGRSKDRQAGPEAQAELARYRDEGIIRQQSKEDNMATPGPRKRKPRIFTGQGIVFAVIDDPARMSAGGDRSGRVSTVDIIADAIEAALDAGLETSEEIARHLTTNSFQHEPDKRVRFNSVLKAGDSVGAQIVRKLHNAYNDLAEMAEEEQDPTKKARIKAEASGFAEALNVVLSPFSCEDETDHRLVNWDEVDRLTDLFEKEQRQVRRERKGKPQ